MSAKRAKPKDRKGKMTAAAGLTIGGAVTLPLAISGNASAASVSQWDKIAACESGDSNVPNSGRWNISFGHADSTGGLQIQTRTWNEFKSGISSASQAYQATKRQQILVAEKILARQGPGAWVCNNPGHGIASGALSSSGPNASHLRGGVNPYASAPPPKAPVPAPPAPKPAPDPKPAPPKADPPVEKPDPPKQQPDNRRPESHIPHDHHTVKSGDTLYGIAKLHGVKGGWPELFRWNTRVVEDPDLIYPGEELNVPRATAPPATPAPNPPTPPPPPASPPPVTDADKAEAEVVRLVNVERAKHGLKAVQRGPKTSAVARAYAAEMARTGRFEHGDVAGRLKAAGITYRSYGENIAKGQRTAAEVMDEWMKSPGHRANILNRDFTHLGAGVHFGTDGRGHWVQDFLALDVSAPKQVASHVSPVNGRLSQPYGNPGNYGLGYHTGADFSAPVGTPVVAAASGTAVLSGGGGAYGNHVVIRHAEGVYTLYAHLSAIHVTQGAAVKAGARIGSVGSTGNSTGAHLHFELRNSATAYAAGVFKDPIAWLRSHGVRV